jgi:FHA domain
VRDGGVLAKEPDREIGRKCRGVPNWKEFDARMESPDCLELSSACVAATGPCCYKPPPPGASRGFAKVADEGAMANSNAEVPVQDGSSKGPSPSPGKRGETGSVAPLRLVLYPNGASIELDRPDMVVGRHADSDVRLHLPDVSRRHCRFLFSDGHWQVLDLHSTNGVFVNDVRVDQAVLRQRDLVRIGSYTFEVKLCQESPPATADLTRSGGSNDPPRRKAS